jgi:hypothetical protein
MHHQPGILLVQLQAGKHEGRVPAKFRFALVSLVIRRKVESLFLSSASLGSGLQLSQGSARGITLRGLSTTRRVILQGFDAKAVVCRPKFRAWSLAKSAASLRKESVARVMIRVHSCELTQA